MSQMAAHHGAITCSIARTTYVHHGKYIKVDDAMDIIWSMVELYRSEYDDIRNKLEERGFEMEA